LAQFGGLDGIRDENLLESALARPKNRFLYDSDADLAAIAAAYGFGLVHNHPFHDGNKRTGFQSVGLFLLKNGQRLVAEQPDAIKMMLRLATSTLSEEEFAVWIRAHMKRRD